MVSGDSTLRVVHVYDGHERVYDGRGSVPGVVWNLARETAATGHDVTVVERQWSGLGPVACHDGVHFERLALRTGADEPWTRVPYELVDSPVSLTRLVGDRMNFALAALRRLRRLDPDIVHVHLPFAASVLVTVAPWFRSRTVYTAHLGELRLDLLDSSAGTGPDTEESDGLSAPSILQYLSPDEYLAKRTAHTTVLNTNIREAFIDRGVPAERVSVVPNGVDFDRFATVEREQRAAVRERHGLDASITLLFVGTVMPRKGVTVMIDALNQVVNGMDDPDVELVIAGENSLDESYTSQVRQRIRMAGLERRVTMTGFVPADQLPALYASADLLVVPSLEEGFGMTAVEAMAAGTPVVATSVGGLPDVITDGESGVLVPPGDAEALAVGLESLLTDDEFRDRIAESAHERAAQYDWGQVTGSICETYERISREANRS